MTAAVEQPRTRRRRYAEDHSGFATIHASAADRVSNIGRLSADSGAGSLEDCCLRTPTTPIPSWGGIRRHTAPVRKQTFDSISTSPVRPNTVHAWDRTPCRGALSKYRPLPAIGFSKDVRDSPDDISKSLYRFHLRSTDSETDSDFDETEMCVYPSEDEEEPRQRRPILRSATFTIDKRVPNNERWTLLLAVRLPDGSRVSGHFDQHDTLASVCDYATKRIDTFSGERYELITTDVPKRVFTDLSISLEAAGIEDKTLLHLQAFEDTDSA